MRKHRHLVIMGKQIRHLRAARGLTIRQLAELSGLGLQYVSNIERAERNVGVTAIFQIARALDVPASELVRGIP